MGGLEKTALDGADISTDGHGDSMTNSAQWGRVGEKFLIMKLMFTIMECYVAAERNRYNSGFEPFLMKQDPHQKL